MAAVGRNDGVAQIGPVHLSGFVGWLAWLVLHIVRIHGMSGRFLVLVSWISGFLFADRPVRLVIRPRQPMAEPAVGSSRRSAPDRFIEPASPSAANVDDWGRTAAPAWRTQDLPGRESQGM
jgi:hypothetical protein